MTPRVPEHRRGGDTSSMDVATRRERTGEAEPEGPNLPVGDEDVGQADPVGHADPRYVARSSGVSERVTRDSARRSSCSNDAHRSQL